MVKSFLNLNLQLLFGYFGFFDIRLVGKERLIIIRGYYFDQYEELGLLFFSGGRKEYMGFGIWGVYWGVFWRFLFDESKQVVVVIMI